MMRSPFDMAMRAVEDALGPGAAQHVRRTEAREDGALIVTVERDSEVACFEWRGERLRELALANDDLLPAAAAIDAARARGTAELLSWRPGRRAVAVIAARDAGQVVKAWKRGRARKAARLHELVRSSLDRDGFAVPRIQRVDDAMDTVTYEVARGSELELDDVAACARIGRSLAQFQRRVPVESLPSHGRSEEFEQLRAASRRYLAAVGSLPTGFTSTFEDLEPWSREGAEPTVAAHRDLHDGQFLVSPDRVVLLDLDLCARCEPELDVANFAVHVLWCGMQGVRGVDETSARLAERAFSSGAAAGLDPRALAFYRAATALRLSLVFGMRPRWSARAARLVDLAAEFRAEVARAR